MFNRLKQWWSNRAKQQRKLNKESQRFGVEQSNQIIEETNAEQLSKDYTRKSQEARLPKEQETARPVSLTRHQIEALLRENTARIEQAKANEDSASEITLDANIAETISNASILRTDLPDKAGTFKGTDEQAHRRRSSNVLSPVSYKLPSIDLLEAPFGRQKQNEEELRKQATILTEKLKEFAIAGQVHRINPGPVVTTFEFKPDSGIKYNRIADLADDLCLALEAESIRIQRIPGKSTVGIEVSYSHREKVLLRDMIESSKFQQSESQLTIALGKTFNGEVYIADLVKMPHLLISGTTGSGKSVTLNTIICSILFRSSHEEVKFIMFDPKRVELGAYEGLPHLLAPIITDPHRAINSFKWAISEMENRYKEFAALGVADIEQYNRQLREIIRPKLYEKSSEPFKLLPYIVIAIEGFTDLVMVAREQVESLIDQLAQGARTAGIHLVLVTQRPSVDVITGAIKANIPSRIALRVSSKTDSRTIIDSVGAESLLGDGDMLFLPSTSAQTVRIHGSYISHTEVKRITDYIRMQSEPQYVQQVTMTEQEIEDVSGLSGERDELFNEALMIVTDMGRASTSVLQRRLSIGYGRAMNILDAMERQGLIGRAEGVKPRKVLSAAYEFRNRIEQH